MSLISQPFKIGINVPELVRNRAKASTVRILENVHAWYKKFVLDWARVSAPKDTGDLMRDLIQSSTVSYVQDSELLVGIVLFLDSMMDYSQRVNDLVIPQDHWTNPLTKPHFFDALVAAIEDGLHLGIQLAIDKEES